MKFILWFAFISSVVLALLAVPVALGGLLVWLAHV